MSCWLEASQASSSSLLYVAFPHPASSFANRTCALWSMCFCSRWTTAFAVLLLMSYFQLKRSVCFCSMWTSAFAALLLVG